MRISDLEFRRVLFRSWIPPGPQARAGRNTDRDEKMAGAKNHDYHILPPSFWPLLGAFSALAMAAGGIMWMHGGHLSPDTANGGGWIFFLGLAGVLLTLDRKSTRLNSSHKCASRMP